jgi:hypothetical protein
MVSELDVYHFAPSAGFGLENAIVLCAYCHERFVEITGDHEVEEDFPESIKAMALIKSGYRCQCQSPLCQHENSA